MTLAPLGAPAQATMPADAEQKLREELARIRGLAR